MQGGKAAGYDSLRQTGAKEEKRPFWHPFRAIMRLKALPFLSPGQKMKLRACGFEIVCEFVPGFVPNAYARTRGGIRRQGGQNRQPNLTQLEWRRDKRA